MNLDTQIILSLATRAVAHRCHCRNVNCHNDQRQCAQDRRYVPNIFVVEAGYSTRPMPKNWRAQPCANPAHSNLRAKRLVARRDVVFEVVVQDSGHDHTDDKQYEKADKTHADHVRSPKLFGTQKSYQMASVGPRSVQQQKRPSAYLQIASNRARSRQLII
jgi:hypothetical protein